MDFASQRIQCCFDLISVNLCAPLCLCGERSFQRRAHKITGVGCVTQPYDRLVFFLSAAQELCQPRRASHQYDQHAGSERIERPGVTDAPLAGDLSHARNHVMRSHACRLVDYERSIHARYSRLWAGDCLCVPPCPLWLNTISFTTEYTEENKHEEDKTL